MGNTFKTGNYVNAIFQDSSNNIGIGAANSSYKLQVTGTTNLTGALSGTTSAFTTRVDIGTRSSGNIRNLNIYGATNGNAIIKLDGADGNGYGAQIDFISKTSGGTSNTWTLGTGVTGGANAFELFNGTSTIFNLALSGAATFSSSLTVANGVMVVDASSSARSAINIKNTGNGVDIGIENASGNYFGAPAYSLNFQTGNYPMLFWTNNTERMSTTQRYSVRANGGIYNYQANDVNLSDERTKKDITPLESYWNKFKAIEIVKFKYKDQTHDDFNIGVIAQQVESVAPEFVDVDGWDYKRNNNIVSDEEPLKAIYTADLHHATIKVLQEAMTKIEQLEEKVKQLENK